MSTQLYTKGNCGFRQVVSILEIINSSFNNILGEIPCHNTIENWVKKCGLDSYQSSGKQLNGSKYAQIVDESMMIGSEKLLLTLGIPAKHTGKPLTPGDVKILDMAVADSWNGERVAERLTIASARVGHHPEYVISDNASIMNKGVLCANFKHQHDISHSLGMFLERTYKYDQEFIDFCKLMTAPKFKHNMKKIAYLLPPKQRTIARFMNMNDWVVWADRMLEIYQELSDEEQDVFSFIPENASLIKELQDVLQCIKRIESICKNTGFSANTTMQCKQEVKRCLFQGNERMMGLGKQIYKFLVEEMKTIAKDAIHNNSSDAIESIFGKYKLRKSPNKLNGVTSFVLFIPLYAALSKNADGAKYDFKVALENIRMKDIKMWEGKNLTQNLSQLRIRKLKKTA